MSESILNAGRELDALIAEKVMGFKLAPGPGELGIIVNITELRRIPHYSTSIADAWEVVEHIRNNQPVNICKFDEFQIHDSKQWTVGWGTYGFDNDFSFEIYAEADSLPHAICLAALKAVEAPNA